MVKKHKKLMNVWDLGILAIIGFYAYGIFIDIEGRWWKIYSLFASGIFFTFIVLKVNTYIIRKSSM